MKRFDSQDSGDFILPAPDSDRVFLTSTNSALCSEPSGICGVSFLTSGGRTSFSAYFLSRIAAGKYIHPSWAEANLNILSNSALYGQKPQIEATGDGIPNQDQDARRTGTMALEYRPIGDARP